MCRMSACLYMLYLQVMGDVWRSGRHFASLDFCRRSATLCLAFCLKLINHYDTSCIVVCHRFQNARYTFEPHFLMHNQTRIQCSSLTHCEHGAKTLSLHSKRSVESEFIEQNHIDRKGYVTCLFAGGMAELYMSSQLAKRKNRVTARFRDSQGIN